MPVWLDTLSRIVHVLTAVTLIGGSIFATFVLAPALQPLEEANRRSLADAVSSRWKRFVHLGILLFLVSGFYNYVQAMPNHKGDGAYHALLGTKILAAFAVFFIASALVGRSAALQFMRDNRQRWMNVLVFLGLLIICISSYVKVNLPPKPPATAIPVAQSLTSTIHTATIHTTATSVGLR